MRIVATIGDVNGIGLEVLLKAAARLGNTRGDITIGIVGNILSIDEYLKKYLKTNAYKITGNEIIAGKSRIRIEEIDTFSKVEPGSETAEAGRLAIQSIETAYKLVVAGEYDAMVTMPISKRSAHKSGFGFPGHTEMLAAMGNTDNPLMILFSGKFRVALATVHIPLNKVPGLISIGRIEQKAKQFDSSLRIDFGIKKPCIAVLGLNPHAGEGGDIGKEELTIIEPDIKKLGNYGIDACGPFPADGFFARREYTNFDGVLAMYHDQGLIPLKLMAKGGVNFTAGLPIVRTSPDHGTAFAIAGKGIASELGTLNAILSAEKIYKSRRRYNVRQKN
jgi:4-hydroxythreonine-4-phosphate dehydrogenase